MSDYRVYAKRSIKRLRQRFYVVCAASNGEPVWRTELYRDKAHAIKTAQEWAGYCDGNYVDADLKDLGLALEIVLGVLAVLVVLMILTGVLVALILGLAAGAMFVVRLIVPRRRKHGRRHHG